MIYNIVFISGLLLESIIKITSQILNVINLKRMLLNPKRELKKTFTLKFLKKTYDYSKIKLKLSIIINILAVIVLITLIYSGLFIKISLFVSSRISNHLFVPLIFLGILLLVSYILSIPFSIIDTFFIEKKFGFSTITIKTFILDNIKVLLLTAILGSLLFIPVFAFILKFKQTWWLWTWGIFTLFSLIIIKIFPSFIAPLFNKFTPIKDGSLKKQIMSMAKKAKLSIINIFKNDASKRSKHSNAYFTGIGKNKQIVLFDTLLEQLTDKEIVGVLAHEIGHYKKLHIWKMFIIQTLITGFSIYLVKQLIDIPDFINAFNLTQIPYLIKFIFSLLFLNSFLWLLQFPITLLSRRHEFSADKYSAILTKNPKYLISSLIKLTKDNLSNPYPHKLYSTLYYSHPPLIERIHNLKTLKKC